MTSFALPATTLVSPPRQYDPENESAFRQQVAMILDSIAATAEQRYVKSGTYLEIDGGMVAPGTVTGKARVYVDVADGSLKVKFSNGTVKVLATNP